MHDLPLISVVTPSFNSEKTIEKTLQSILDQSYSKVEYILIDGGSKDRTLEVFEVFRPKLEEKGIIIKVVSEPDQGIYDAMNKGIALASGEVIGILNSDDWYEPRALERVAQTYQKDHFDMFYADIRIMSENPDGSLKEKMTKHSRLRTPVVSRDWNHPTTFITKEVYEKYRYKLESVHDDWDLVLRIRKAGYKIVVLNEVLANFRMGGASNHKDIKACVKRIKARYAIYRNNGYSRLYFFECLLIEAAKFVLG